MFRASADYGVAWRQLFNERIRNIASHSSVGRYSDCGDSTIISENIKRAERRQKLMPVEDHNHKQLETVQCLCGLEVSSCTSFRQFSPPGSSTLNTYKHLVVIDRSTEGEHEVYSGAG